MPFCCGVHSLEWCSLIGITTVPAPVDSLADTQLMKLSRDDKDFISVAEEVELWVCDDHVILMGVSQMQRTIREHKDKGAAGGVFKSYEILEVSMLWSHDLLHHWSHDWQIERVINTKMWERYIYRRQEVQYITDSVYCTSALLVM